MRIASGDVVTLANLDFDLPCATGKCDESAAWWFICMACRDHIPFCTRHHYDYEHAMAGLSRYPCYRCKACGNTRPRPILAGPLRICASRGEEMTPQNTARAVGIDLGKQG